MYSLTDEDRKYYLEKLDTLTYYNVGVMITELTDNTPIKDRYNLKVSFVDLSVQRTAAVMAELQRTVLYKNKTTDLPCQMAMMQTIFETIGYDNTPLKKYIILGVIGDLTGDIVHMRAPDELKIVLLPSAHDTYNTHRNSFAKDACEAQLDCYRFTHDTYGEHFFCIRTDMDGTQTLISSYKSSVSHRLPTVYGGDIETIENIIIKGEADASEWNTAFGSGVEVTPPTNGVKVKIRKSTLGGRRAAVDRTGSVHTFFPKVRL